MKFDIIDLHWSNDLKIVSIITFILIIIQNIAQIIKTYQVKSVKEFSEYYIIARILSCYILLFYGIQQNSLYVMIINILPIISTTFIGYYKIKEISDKCYKNKYRKITDINFVDSLIIEDPPTYK